MEDNTTTVDKSIVEELDFGTKTAKRVGWEAFEFTLVGPYQVKVINASYGTEKEDHAYVVGIDEREDFPIPAECDCPADIHREPDCKHKVALATVGGPVVLNAAVEFEDTSPPLSRRNSEGVTTAADKLQPDGGESVRHNQRKSCTNGNVHCDGPNGEELPCFACYEMDR